MCNAEISKGCFLSLFSFFFFFHGCSAGKLKWFLFASHGALLKGGGERASTNEVQRDVNFSNTKCSESPAVCFVLRRKVN